MSEYQYESILNLLGLISKKIPSEWPTELPMCANPSFNNVAVTLERSRRVEVSEKISILLRSSRSLYNIPTPQNWSPLDAWLYQRRVEWILPFIVEGTLNKKTISNHPRQYLAHILTVKWEEIGCLEFERLLTKPPISLMDLVSLVNKTSKMTRHDVAMSIIINVCAITASWHNNEAISRIASFYKLEALKSVVAGLKAGYEYYNHAMCYGARLAFPAQELVLIEKSGRKNKRIRERWEEYGGSMLGKRRVALKTDPIWANISFFGFPFPPFDVSCGYGVEAISRGEAIRLGIIDEYHKEPNRVELAPNPSFSFEDESYMHAVCQRIVDIIVD